MTGTKVRHVASAARLSGRTRKTGRAVAAFMLAGFVTTGATTAYATEEDAQVWTVLNVTGKLNDKVVLAFDGQTRFSNDAQRLGQLLLRPSVGWRLDSTTTASLGYAYVRTAPLGRPTTHEHRAWQQLSYRLAGDGKGVTLTGRTRLEERRVEGRDETGWRLRQQIRVTAPLKNGVRGVAWTEPFVGLNQTGWGQREGLNVLRSFVGVSAPITKTVTLEPGYLNQRTYRVGPDLVAHTAALWINVQF